MKSRITGVAAAVLLSACHQPTSTDTTNAQMAIDNGVSVVANAVSAVVKSGEPGAVCTAPETETTLRKLIGAQIAANARNGLRWSSAIQQIMMADRIGGGSSTTVDLGFGGTTVDSVDAQTEKVSCTTSIVVEGEEIDGNHSRLSFSVQQPVDGTGNIVTITDPLQVEAAGPALIGGIQHKLKINADAEKSSGEEQPDTPDQAGSATAPNNVQ